MELRDRRWFAAEGEAWIPPGFHHLIAVAADPTPNDRAVAGIKLKECYRRA
jgi:hypothetical protein